MSNAPGGRSIGILRRGERTIREKEVLLGYALVLPSLILVAITLLYPVAYNVLLSFSRIPLDPAASREWVGLENYVDLVTSPDFLLAVRNTFVFTLFSDLGATVVGLFVALLFAKQFRGRNVARGLVLLPYIAPLIASAFVWRWMWNPLFGVGPYLLVDVLGVVENASGLKDSLAMVVVFDSWRYFPFAFLLIVARVQAIPEELYEAARLDGAGRIAQFKDITLPELKYVIATVFLLRWIWNFNVFADVWLFTRDVPVLGTFIYVTGFNNFNQGLAAATAMLMVVFLIALVTVYVRYLLDW